MEGFFTEFLLFTSILLSIHTVDRMFIHVNRNLTKIVPIRTSLHFLCLESSCVVPPLDPLVTALVRTHFVQRSFPILAEHHTAVRSDDSRDYSLDDAQIVAVEGNSSVCRSPERIRQIT